MPRQTKDTALPKPPPPPIDWVKIAQSGRVWEFIEGEDFTGQASSFRARAKTAARKLGVDFDSAETQRSGKAVLKILAFVISAKRAPETAARAQSKPATDDRADRAEVGELAGQLALDAANAEDGRDPHGASPPRQARHSVLP